MFYSVFSRKPVAYNGRLAADPDGARVEFFDAGTNTVRTMYSDGALTAALDPLDIRTDANGCFPAIYGQGGPYKAKVYAPGGSVLYTEDDIPGDVAAGGGGGGGGTTTQETGDIQPSILSGSRSGWVRANGRTIGSALSLATELADDTAEDLFLGLWPNTLFVVSGGRGANAPADWSANKTIALPDARLCALIGADGMGASATNLFSALTFSSGNAATVGSKVGNATETLSAAQLAAHTHTGSTTTDGNHQHSGGTQADGNHIHSASADTQGAHSHTVDVEIAGATLFVSGGGGNVAQAGVKTYVTGSAGDHSHTISVANAGSHAHLFTTDGAGAHSHSFTTASAGTGAAHANVQNSLLVTFYIKL